MMVAERDLHVGLDDADAAQIALERHVQIDDAVIGNVALEADAVRAVEKDARILRVDVNLGVRIFLAEPADDRRRVDHVTECAGAPDQNARHR
jgi:hypothetical protein